MSTATANGDVAVKGSAAANAAANKHQKSLDPSRKQTASPVDASTKKQAPQTPKAWQGPNPITQRANSSAALPNGNEKPQSRSPAQSQQRTNTPSHAENDAHDRLLYLLAHCKGTDATLTLKNGEQFTGVYSGTSLGSPVKTTYTMKMVKRTRLPSQQVNGTTDLADEYIGEGEDHAMSFDLQDTADLAVSNVVTASAHATQNGTAGSFRTDAEISGREAAPRQRELQKWDGGDDMSLDDMALESSGGTGWDQFAVNERNFGTQSTYNEEEYTTSIDRSHPEYKRRAAQAERLAKEIEGSAPANAHVAEERRRDADRADTRDEEEKYSGVARQLPTGSAGSYVPPSRRPITSQPTVPGAPFDPAIISTSKPAPPSTAQQPASTQEKAEPSKAAEPKDDAKLTAPSITSKDLSVSTSQPQKKAENTTENHVRDTADAFKQFANNEKLKLRAVQEAKRSNQRHEKNVKLNDLKKFAENFKLRSRVPDDLVPILAKDHEKQLEIQRRAEESARDEEVRAKDKVKATPTPPKAGASQAPANAASGDARAQFPQSQNRNRSSQNVRGGMQAITSPPRGNLPHRQQQPFINQRMQGVPPPSQPLSTDIRIPTGPMSSRESGTLSPASTANARLNVNAKEFKFHPTVSNFTPSGASPSPQRATGRPAVPVQSNATFFDEKDEKKSRMPKKDVNTACNTIEYLKKQEYPAEKQKKVAQNGGIPPPFDTPPTWTDPSDHIPASYELAFPKPHLHSQGPSPLHTPNPVGGPMPHAHQLPPHLQAPHMPNAVQPHRFYGPAPHGGQHTHAQSYDPRMQFPNGPGSLQNSPRYAPAQMAGGYNPQMGQMPMGQMPQFAGGAMQGYQMSPSMQHRQMAGPMAPGAGGPMMMMPGQSPYPQMTQMRPGFPGAPNFPPNVAPQMGGQMMMQTPSSGGYPPQGPPQHYSPMPPHAIPQMPQHPPHHQQQHGGPNNFASSPRPGPHMMQHSGSHQGFTPQGGAGMPGFPNQSPYAYQQQRHHSGQGGGGFPQMTPRGQQAMPVPQGGHMPSPGLQQGQQGQQGQAQGQPQAQGQGQSGQGGDEGK